MRRDAKTTCYLLVCRIHIFECKFNEFDAREWPDLDTQGKTKVKVEERYYSLLHYNQKEFQEKGSDLQVARNYSSAMKKIEAKVYEADERNTYMKLVKDGREIWACFNLNPA